MIVIKGIHANYPENYLSTQKVYYEWLTNKKDEDGSTKAFDYKKDEEVLHRDLDGIFIVNGYVENSLPHEYGRYYWIKKQRKAGEVLWETRRMLADGEKLYRANFSCKMSQEAVKERESYWNKEGRDNAFFSADVPTTPTEEKFVLYQANFEGWTKKGKFTGRLGNVTKILGNRDEYEARIGKKKQKANLNVPDQGRKQEWKRCSERVKKWIRNSIGLKKTKTGKKKLKTKTLEGDSK